MVQEGLRPTEGQPSPALRRAFPGSHVTWCPRLPPVPGACLFSHCTKGHLLLPCTFISFRWSLSPAGIGE